MALTQQATWEKIQYNEEQLLIERLGELVTGYDNDILKDKLEKTVNLHGVQQRLIIYSAKKNNRIFAYLIEHTYPNGYNGNIRLLTGVDVDNQLLGVRVITHKETPGLGDKIETRKSNWMKQFKGLSFLNLDKNQWKVKKDGGVFDAFTGATVTPRAIINATSDVLTLLSKPCLINKAGKGCSDK
ncbi:Electron transport complex protein RnfG [uncultured Candidatus Thioglobus sp.]|nr:Electron transport complex protein RnfG [uncultured Candidatus Thioglobus sp.]SMM99468.1 Electron transport complex protein RnfG [uncultured Candidatus Thioglobus sp.]